MKQFFLLTFLLSSLFTFSQEKELQFPHDFFGIYKGNLKITNPKGTQIIPMEFHLKATDSVGKYVYTLVYGEGEQRQERLYNLIAKNAGKGDYVVDENNGLLLDAKVVDNTLYSLFEVQGNLLTTVERFEKDRMFFEITFASKSQKQTTKTTDENATEVQSYPVLVVQKAELLKQKD